MDDLARQVFLQRSSLENPDLWRPPVMPKKYNITYGGKGEIWYGGQIIGNMFTDMYPIIPGGQGNINAPIGEDAWLENWAKQNNTVLQPNREWLITQPGYVEPRYGERIP